MNPSIIRARSGSDRTRICVVDRTTGWRKQIAGGRHHGQIQDTSSPISASGGIVREIGIVSPVRHIRPRPSPRLTPRSRRRWRGRGRSCRGMDRGYNARLGGRSRQPKRIRALVRSHQTKQVVSRWGRHLGCSAPRLAGRRYGLESRGIRTLAGMIQNISSAAPSAGIIR